MTMSSSFPARPYRTVCLPRAGGQAAQNHPAQGPDDEEGRVFKNHYGFELALPLEGTVGWMEIEGRRECHMFTRGHWVAFVKDGTERWA